MEFFCDSIFRRNFSRRMVSLHNVRARLLYFFCVVSRRTKCHFMIDFVIMEWQEGRATKNALTSRVITISVILVALVS